MANDSIARLAVVITGDASPLNREMVRAESNVNRFGRSMESGARSTFKMGQALSASRGNLAAIWGLPGAGPAGALVAASAAAAMFSINIARAADTIQTDLNKAVEDFKAKRQEVFGNGGPQLSFGSERTWSMATAEANEELAKSGNLLSNVFRDLTDGFTMAEKAARHYRRELSFINSGFMLLAPPGVGDDLEKKREELNVANAILESEKARQKLRAEAAKEEEKLRDQGRKRLEDMAKEAKQFIDNLKTPWENLVDDVKRLQGFLGTGAIGEGTFNQSFDRLFEKFLEDTKEKKKTPRDVRGVAAAERFTTSGQSAIESGRRELDRIAKLQQEEVQAAKKAEMQRREIIDVLKNNKPLVLQQGNL